MCNVKSIDSEKKITGYSKVLITMLFIIGFLNSKPYFDFMGYSLFPQLLMLVIYFTTLFLLFLTVMNIMFKRKNYILSSKYWLVLALALLFKYFLLFVQFPSSFLPGHENFYPMLTNLINVFVVFILVESIKTMRDLRLSIWAFGIGAFLSTMIPILLFPEYIGLRANEINGFKISGGFWNQSIISYMSVGWLLLFLSNYEKNKFYKVNAFLMFIIIIIGGMFGLSRAILLSVIMSTFVYLIVSNNLRKYIKSILAITVLVGIGLFLFKDVVESFSDRVDGGLQIEEEARIDIWKDYIKNIPDYFLFGEIEGDYKKYSSSVKKFGPHSVILNWLVQFGVLGLLGFLFLMYGILKSIKNIYYYHSKEFGSIVIAWFVAYMSIAAINETGFDQLSVFAAIGIILAWGNIAKISKSSIYTN